MGQVGSASLSADSIAPGGGSDLVHLKLLVEIPVMLRTGQVSVWEVFDESANASPHALSKLEGRLFDYCLFGTDTLVSPL